MSEHRKLTEEEKQQLALLAAKIVAEHDFLNSDKEGEARFEEMVNNLPLDYLDALKILENPFACWN